MHMRRVFVGSRYALSLMANSIAASLASAVGVGMPIFTPILDYRANAGCKSQFKRRGARSKYMPHQGERECARRRAAYPTLLRQYGQR